MKIKIALTMGDPAGIGPELAVKAAVNREFATTAEIYIYGAPDILSEAAKRFNMPFDKLNVVATDKLCFSDIKIGENSAECGVVAKDAVEQATLDCIAGKMDAVVTLPMNKASVNLAGIPFTGHTEFIAGLCGCRSFAMMQSAENLRVVFVTTHIPLADVAKYVTEDRIIEVAHLLNQVVKDEGVANPKLAAAAINPHAGENGFMGNEDELCVKPALEKLRQSQIDIDGPFPPDTLFISSTLKKYDGIVSMYHDQGHIPFKMLAFDKGVNSTLGLPIIRTSVDHGTAFDIAWQGKADSGSINAAIRTAILRGRAKKAKLC